MTCLKLYVSKINYSKSLQSQRTIAGFELSLRTSQIAK